MICWPLLWHFASDVTNSAIGVRICFSTLSRTDMEESHSCALNINGIVCGWFHPWKSSWEEKHQTTGHSPSWVFDIHLVYWIINLFIIYIVHGWWSIHTQFHKNILLRIAINETFSYFHGISTILGNVLFFFRYSCLWIFPHQLRIKLFLANITAQSYLHCICSHTEALFQNISLVWVLQ